MVMHGINGFHSQSLSTRIVEGHVTRTARAVVHVAIRSGCREQKTCIGFVDHQADPLAYPLQRPGRAQPAGLQAVQPQSLQGAAACLWLYLPGATQVPPQPPCRKPPASPAH